MLRPTFASPLPQSDRSEVLEWRFPKPYNGYVLTGKSRAAWHTSFVIPQLNLLLDAGLCVNKLRPKHIFLTHGHSDHTLLSPAFVKREDPPDVFCPAEMAGVFDEFIRANTMLNLGGLVGEEDAWVSSGDDEGEGDAAAATAAQNGDKKWLRCTHVTNGLRPGDTVPLRRLKTDVWATAFACDHSVPCLGYVFGVTNRRLRPEHVGRSGPELQALRQAGVKIAAPVRSPVFAFLGDTTPAPLVAEPDWLRDGIPVVITECSFLHAEHKPQADRTKHTVWADLEKVIRKWPRTTFVLMHFSLRYSDEDIRRFFNELDDPPSNIVVWVDGGT